MDKKYTLPELPYDYDALEPYISEKQLTIHHDKHHQGYVTKANNTLAELEEARKSTKEISFKNKSQFLAYALGGHKLHTLFWQNMTPAEKTKERPEGELLKAIKEDFGSFERFKKEFQKTTSSVEGSGWGALVYEPLGQRLLCEQIEKHHLLLPPQVEALLVVDVWEHAYYLDYENNRDDFIDAFWEVVNWEEVAQHFEKARK